MVRAAWQVSDGACPDGMRKACERESSAAASSAADADPDAVGEAADAAEAADALAAADEDDPEGPPVAVPLTATADAAPSGTTGG
jgi:hypothetical protein